MFKHLGTLFTFKLYVRIDIFRQIRKEHGQSILNIVRKYEQLKFKLMKIQTDITFIKTFKVEDLTSALKNTRDWGFH